MSLQTHARLDRLCADVEQLTVDASSVSRATRDAIAAAAADVRDDLRAVSTDITARTEALEATRALSAHAPGAAAADASPGRNKREAGLWKVLECAVRDAEARVLEVAARRGDAADAAVKRCARAAAAALWPVPSRLSCLSLSKLLAVCFFAKDPLH